MKQASLNYFCLHLNAKYIPTTVIRCLSIVVSNYAQFPMSLEWVKIRNVCYYLDAQCPNQVGIFFIYIGTSLKRMFEK